MRVSPRLAQLYALRAQVDALIVAEEGETGPPREPGSCPLCGAGSDQQEDKSTIDGTKRVYCRACRQWWEPSVVMSGSV